MDGNGELIPPTQDRGEASGWVIIHSLEKAESSSEETVSIEDHQLKTCENGGGSSAVEKLPKGAIQVLPQPGEEHDLENTPDVTGECNENNQDDIKLHDTSVLPVNSQEVVNLQDADASNTTVVEEVKPPGEAALDPPIAGKEHSLKKTPALSVDQLEVDNIAKNPDDSNTPVADEFQLLREAVTDQLHCEEINDSKNVFAEVNGNCYEYNKELSVDNTFAVNSADIMPTSDRCCTTSSIQEGFHSTIINLPIPENFRIHRWEATNAHIFNPGTSGFSYFGNIAEGQRHGFGRLMLGDSEEFFEGIWNKNHLVQLKSCSLTFDPDFHGNQTCLIIRRKDDYLLTMYETHYVARVTFDALEELDFNIGVGNLKDCFFSKLKFLELVADELDQKEKALLDKFVALLAGTLEVDSDPMIRANIFVFLGRYMARKEIDLLNTLLGTEVPDEVKAAAADLLDCEKGYSSNPYLFPDKAAGLKTELQNVLAKTYMGGINQHRQMLIDKCPSAFPNLLSSIRSLQELKIVYITREDMRIFDHLATQPCFEHYQHFFSELANKFCQTIYNIKIYTDPCDVIPVMSPVYGYLVKSFWEVISEIMEVVDCYEYKDMLKRVSGKWKLLETIKWPQSESDNSINHRGPQFFKSSANKSPMHHKALEILYKIIFQKMEYFSPEKHIKDRKYEPKFLVLEQDLSWWEKGQKMIQKKVGLAKRLQELRTERIVWLCLFDHTLNQLFKCDPNCQILLKHYSLLFEIFISHIETSRAENYEEFRVMMHRTLKFVISTAPYLREAREKLGTDMRILLRQMWGYFSAASKELEKDPKFSDFGDTLAEYNRYLNLRLVIDIEPSSGYFSEQISQMMQTFVQISATSFEKLVQATILVRYMRALNDFLDDLNNIDFLSMWFVKSTLRVPDVLEKVNNKLTGENCSYRVVDIEKFVKVSQILGNCPRHHIVQVVSQLLKCIETCLNKQWDSRDADLQVTQLECTALLLDATRKSFMYLKEQPDYVDFETFEKESIDPFVRLVHDCETLLELKNRLAKVSESFWYIRKMDEIGIERALEMFNNDNNCQVSDKLLHCYNLFLEKYEDIVTKYRSQVTDAKSHTESLNEVLQEINIKKSMHFSMWTEEFKTKEIPVILAGLSAVWSILVSKDVSSAGKFLKPHCIQILCILRLLSVDLENIVENHLAQVLTGQGKSVILGLLSSLLAMTGHEVRVLCYSDYLSSRDQTDFDEFFSMFQLGDKIEYDTFERMTFNLVQPVINGQRTSLSKIVERRLINHSSWPPEARLTQVSKNTILLIDEVDVFFNEQFYGDTYCGGVCPGFSGLAKLQEYIWSVASNYRSYHFGDIKQRSMEYIENQVAARNSDMVLFKAFLSNPGTFSLLDKDADGCLFIKTYTNRSLFDKALPEMIRDALDVRDNCNSARVGFKIADDGTITLKDNTYGDYRDIRVGYRNVFNYFRLKQSDFDSKGFRNYGYFDLWMGEISYSRLPSQFQLILGVSGTLTDLGAYEKSGIAFYGIHNFSVLPSFFGESNLEFSKERDFHYFHMEKDWLKEIYDRANSIVDSHRAILIFFESDDKMDEFSKEYKNKFYRLNEISENTDERVRDEYINGAGLPGTVTLATRGMGRGVDYKSSLSVDKKGGVHVVQTFLSVDVKEEVQIKGRTARKDNKGSYELIICRDHLVKDNIIRASDFRTHDYRNLDTFRRKLCNEKGETVNERIRKCEQNHNTTMEYFGLK